MKYLLDTDTCIGILRGHSLTVRQASEHAPDELAVSSITRYELRYGVERCAPQRRKREHQRVEQFLAMLHEIPFTGEVAEGAARLRFKLERKGEPIGPMDTLIAATALVSGLTLVSGNLGEFRRVPGLPVVSWLDPEQGMG
jgi:tRNA(fMet)-specific endonuclease VapC